VYTINENNERVPLVQKSEYQGKEYFNYVYKMINAWGDSFRAQEFYGKEFPLDPISTVSRSSVLDNGFLKVMREVEDSEIELALLGTTQIVSATVESTEVKTIAMQPDNVAKIKAGTKNITNRTEKEKLEDGVYALPDGTKVEVKLIGKAIVQNDKVYFDNGEFISGDQYAKAEGFKDWNDFKKNNKFSTNFINGSQNRYVYSIKTVSEKPDSISQEENNTTPIEGLKERLQDYGFTDLVIPSNYFEGPRPNGRLNSFKDSIKKVADNLQVLKDLNLNEFDFLSDNDKQRLDALRSKAEEFSKLNMTISSSKTRTVAVEKRYAQLSNEILNEFVDIVGKHVKQQLGKTIETSNLTGKNSPEGLEPIDRTNKKC
jgi:hypothetical protein